MFFSAGKNRTNDYFANPIRYVLIFSTRSISSILYVVNLIYSTDTTNTSNQVIPISSDVRSPGMFDDVAALTPLIHCQMYISPTVCATNLIGTNEHNWIKVHVRICWNVRMLKCSMLTGHEFA